MQPSKAINGLWFKSFSTFKDRGISYESSSFHHRNEIGNKNLGQFFCNFLNHWIHKTKRKICILNSRPRQVFVLLQFDETHNYLLMYVCNYTYVFWVSIRYHYLHTTALHFWFNTHWAHFNRRFAPAGFHCTCLSLD